MSVCDFLQLLILMFWWLPVGLFIRLLQILQDRRKSKEDEEPCRH